MNTNPNRYITVVYEFKPACGKGKYMAQAIEGVSVGEFYESLRLSSPTADSVVPMVRLIGVMTEFCVDWKYTMNKDTELVFYDRVQYFGKIGITMLQRLWEANETGVEFVEYGVYATEIEVFLRDYAPFVDQLLKGAQIGTGYGASLQSYRHWLKKPLRITEDCSVDIDECDEDDDEY
jgi:hypothetical protein